MGFAIKQPKTGIAGSAFFWSLSHVVSGIWLFDSCTPGSPGMYFRQLAFPATHL
jgi:hypothetical protein